MDERGDRGVELLEVVEAEPDEHRMVGGEAAGKGQLELGDLGPQPALGARPDTPSGSEATESSRMPASVQVFSMRWISAVRAWIVCLR